jgi:hypothetical protein
MHHTYNVTIIPVQHFNTLTATSCTDLSAIADGKIVYTNLVSDWLSSAVAPNGHSSSKYQKYSASIAIY